MNFEIGKLKFEILPLAPSSTSIYVAQVILCDVITKGRFRRFFKKRPAYFWGGVWGEKIFIN